MHSNTEDEFEEEDDENDFPVLGTFDFEPDSKLNAFLSSPDGA